MSLVPWTSKSKVKGEVLPLSMYFVEDISELILTNYKIHFGQKVFAKLRTDPTVIRGEKRYLQTCLGCHSQSKLPAFGDLAKGMDNRGGFDKAHGEVGGVPPFSDFDFKSLKSYFEAMLSSDVARNQ